jgi:hypothetical protein
VQHLWEAVAVPRHRKQRPNGKSYPAVHLSLDAASARAGESWGKKVRGFRSLVSGKERWGAPTAETRHDMPSGQRKGRVRAATNAPSRM